MDLLFEPHEREAHTLHLFVGQRASFHTPHRLPFEELPQEFNEREHELGEPMFDPFRVNIHPFGQDATKSLHLAAQVVEFGVDAQSVLANV